MGNDELLEKYMSGKPFKMSELEQEENRRFQNGTLFPVYHGRGYPKTAVTTVTAVTPKDGHPPKERRNPPMPYAILRFQKRKAAALRLVNATTSGRKKPTKATQI